MLKVTIGLCVKNSEKTVKEAIDSVINQDFPHEEMEIIVVDGGSEDRTLDIITDRVSKINIQTKIYDDGGNGLGVARQIVVDKACGKYIVWVDGDVILSKDFSLKQVEFMEQNPHVGIAGARYRYISKEGKLVNDLQSLLCRAESTDAWMGSNISRIEALRQVGGFDKRIKGACEDIDIIARIKAADWLVSINQEAKFYHNCRDTWRDLWNEQKWFGYGGHYISHKHKFVLWRRVPPASFMSGLMLALKVYKLTYQKKSFLLPSQSVFQSIAWCLGFIKSHMDGYGHGAG